MYFHILFSPTPPSGHINSSEIIHIVDKDRMGNTPSIFKKSKQGRIARTFEVEEIQKKKKVTYSFVQY